MDLFADQSASPMLIAEMQKPFDNTDYIYELKLDGERCLAYLDKDSAALRNKRDFNLNIRFPELSEIYKAVNVKCILDGEITVFTNGKPDFSIVQRRSLLTNQMKVDLLATRYPACFTAFDILYYNDHQVTDMPLMERKKLLNQAVAENNRISISRYIEGKGVEFYNLVVGQQLEGVVAKRKDSLYHMGKRTKEWIKFKRLLDDDFVVCGYQQKRTGTSIVLGQYKGNDLVYKGNVSSGVSETAYCSILKADKSICPFPVIPKGNEGAIWIRPDLVCIVQWMPRQNGALNQAVFKGLRDDKAPKECVTIG